mmetsp:Transcript_66688/g.192665  ORF Transcript_66688/g.192665 Transcript_66688/m.192665 type:complete len:206 (-) Transcript_66688:1050-1667(-)
MPSASCRPGRHVQPPSVTTSEDAGEATTCRQLPETSPPELHDSEESYHAKSKCPSSGENKAESWRPVPSTTSVARSSPQAQPNAISLSSLMVRERPYPRLNSTHSPRFIVSTCATPTVPTKAVDPAHARPRYTENSTPPSVFWHTDMAWKAPSLNCVAAWQVHALKSAGADETNLQPPTSALFAAQSADEAYHATSDFPSPAAKA